ncbi:MAG: hypothetical protein AB7U83_23440 [Vicinamibacterales bacterium]
MTPPDALWTELEQLHVGQAPRYAVAEYGACAVCLAGPTLVTTISTVIWCACEPCANRWPAPPTAPALRPTEAEDYLELLLAIFADFDPLNTHRPPFDQEIPMPISRPKTQPPPAAPPAAPLDITALEQLHGPTGLLVDPRLFRKLPAELRELMTAGAFQAVRAAPPALTAMELDALAHRVWEQIRDVPIGPGPVKKPAATVARDALVNAPTGVLKDMIRLLQGALGMRATLLQRRGEIDRALAALDVLGDQAWRD